MDHGVSRTFSYIRRWPFWRSPGRTVDPLPPLGANDGVRRLQGRIIPGQIPLEDKRPAKSFGIGYIASRFDKPREVAVPNRIPIHEKQIHMDRSHGPFTVRRESFRDIGAHLKGATGNQHHLVRRPRVDTRLRMRRLTGAEQHLRPQLAGYTARWDRLVHHGSSAATIIAECTSSLMTALR